MNPLFNLLSGNRAVNNSPLGNMMGFLQSFNQFRQTFTGNPQQQVQQLISSGKISQEDYNRAVQMAQQIQSMINGK